MDNHYVVLNIAMDAPDAVVRAAYRVLAAQFHPDRHAADPAMLQRMQAVNAAWRVLSDPTLRAEHDAQLRRQWRRRASDSAAVPSTVCAEPPRARVDAVADAAGEKMRALAHRRAVVAGLYATNAVLR